MSGNISIRPNNYSPAPINTPQVPQVFNENRYHANEAITAAHHQGEVNPNYKSKSPSLYPTRYDSFDVLYHLEKIQSPSSFATAMSDPAVKDFVSKHNCRRMGGFLANPQMSNCDHLQIIKQHGFEMLTPDVARSMIVLEPIMTEEEKTQRTEKEKEVFNVNPSAARFLTVASLVKLSELSSKNGGEGPEKKISESEVSKKLLELIKSNNSLEMFAKQKGKNSAESI